MNEQKLNLEVNNYINLLYKFLKLELVNDIPVSINAMINRSSNLILIRVLFGVDNSCFLDLDGIEWNYCYNLLDKKSAEKNFILDEGKIFSFGEINFIIKDKNLTSIDSEDDAKALMELL
jgi:hypothetical protein